MMRTFGPLQATLLTATGNPLAGALAVANEHITWEWLPFSDQQQQKQQQQQQQQQQRRCKHTVRMVLLKVCINNTSLLLMHSAA